MTFNEIDKLAESAANAARNAAFDVINKHFKHGAFPDAKCSNFDNSVHGAVYEYAATLIRAKLAHDGFKAKAFKAKA